MIYAIIADALVVIHFLFILFVIFGGILTLKWPLTLWAHLPCLAWGLAIEFFGFYCPLTRWEVEFRQLAGQAGYEGGFIQHYLIPIIYPQALTREDQIFLGLCLAVFNLAVYWRLWRQRKHPL